MKFFWCVFIGCILFSCNDPQQKHLISRAEDMLEAFPDSSMYLLKEVRAERLDRAHRAYYALLYTEVLDKNAKEIVSDSLLNIALNYYDSKGNSVALAKCYYYLGCYYWELEEWDKAVNSYVQAESIALSLDEYNLLGLIYARLGRLYIQQFDIEKASTMYDKCIFYYNKAGNKRNEAMALGSKGRTFLYTQQYDSTFYYLDLAKQFHKAQKDTQALNVCLNLEGYLWLKMGNLEKAKQSVDMENARSQYVLLSDVYFAEKQIDSAEYYMHLALQNTHDKKQQIGFYQRLSRIAYVEKDYEGTIAYLRKRCALTDSVYQNFTENSVGKWISKYRYERAQKEAATSKLETAYFQRLLAVVILIFLAIVSVYQFMHSRKSKKLYEDQLLIQKLKTSESELKGLLNEQLKEKSYQLRSFFQNRVNTLKDLIEISYKFKYDTEKFRKNFKELLSKRSFTKEEWQLLREGVNTSMNGLMDYLEDHYPDLSEEDQKYCCLLCAGFTMVEITALLNIKQDSIYKKRNRIRSRLNLEQSVSLEDFLEELRRNLTAQNQQ